MANTYLVGGGESTLIYRLKNDHSIVQADGTTAATTSAHAVFAATTEIESFSMSGTDVNITLIKAAGDVIPFLSDYCSKKAGAEPTTIEAFGESGTKHSRTISAGGGSFADLLVVHKGATEGTKIHTRACVVTLKPESWNYDTVYNDFVRCTIAATMIEAKDAIVIGNALLPSGYDGSATLTIAEGDPFEVADLTAA